MMMNNETTSNNLFIDMDKFMEFVSNVNVKNSDTSISQVWQTGDDEVSNELTMISKDVAETKSNYSDTLYNIRYDFARNILNTVIQVTPDESGLIKNITNTNDMNFAQILCLNSLINQGIIKEYNFNNE